MTILNYEGEGEICAFLVHTNNFIKSGGSWMKGYCCAGAAMAFGNICNLHTRTF